MTLIERLRAWARDAREGRKINGADMDLIQTADALEAAEVMAAELEHIALGKLVNGRIPSLDIRQDRARQALANYRKATQ